MKLPIKLTWEDDEWVFRDADDVRIGGMDALMELVGDLVVQRDVLVKVCEKLVLGERIANEQEDFTLLVEAAEMARAALDLAKGE